MPKRLLEPGSEANDVERLLVAARSEPRPGPQQRALVWQRLMLALPTPAADLSAPLDSPAPGAPRGTNVEPAASAPASPASPSGASSSLDASQKAAPLVASTAWAPLLLSGAAGVIVGVVATSGFFLLREAGSSDPRGANHTDSLPAPNVAQSDPSANRVSSRQARKPVPSVSVEELDEQTLDSRPSHPVSGNGDQRQPAPAPVPVNTAISPLRQEAMLLRRAREQLGRGELSQASDTLSESRNRFPESRLMQERQALNVELLFRQGRHSEAASLAKTFLTQYPHSPHAAQVRRTLQGTKQPDVQTE